MSANTRHVTLAMRAIKTYRTHLRNAHARMCAPEHVRSGLDAEAKGVENTLRALRSMAVEADAHLTAKVASRRAK